MFGRPTSMAGSVIQCRQPFQVDASPGLEPECAFIIIVLSLSIYSSSDFQTVYPWKYSFSRLVSNAIAVMGTSTVVYNDILECEKDLPPLLDWPLRGTTYEVIGRSFQRCAMSIWKQVCE
jgi:hypothetical protein